jgi:CDP-diacylglycerol--serine O-phosphatidyltransferase
VVDVMGYTLFSGRLNAPNALTFSGLICGLTACFLAVHSHTALAYIGLIYAGIFDLFDGWAARRRPRSKDEQLFGIQLDSLVDMASFGFTPVVIALHAGLATITDLALYVAYVAAVALRLAHFNTLQGGVSPASSQAPKYYIGLPVTYAALVFPVLYAFIHLIPRFEGHILRAAFVFLTAAFVLRIPIPKPGGWFFLFFLLLAFTVTIVLSLQSLS